MTSSPNPSEIDRALSRAVAGEEAAWRELVQAHHARLLRMVAVRMDPRLRSRLDAEDVLQDVYLDAAKQFPDYVRDPQLPFFLWLRLLTGHWLARAHRHHLGTQLRDAGRDISICQGGIPDASSAALAAHLLGREDRPSEAAQRAERAMRIQVALDAMEPMDREVLSLRHFEYLSRAESARAMGVSEAAAGKRYLRALAKLKHYLTSDRGGLEGL